MDFNRLLQLLELELSKQEVLLELLSKERAAIVRLDGDEISLLTKKKEKLLDDARAIEQKRSSVIKQLEDSKVIAPDSKLEQILECCKSAEVKAKLKKVRTELKAVTESVRDLNIHNATLIKQTLGVISSTMAIFRSATDAELPAYSARGQLLEGKVQGLPHPKIPSLRAKV